MNNGLEGQAPVLKITRIIQAPLERVWNAWTNCGELKRWWGPERYTCPDCRIDLRVGGQYLFAMQAPEDLGGQTAYTMGEYARIMPGRSLEFTMLIANQDGHRISPTQAGLPADFPRELHAAVSVDAKGDMNQLLTELDLTITGWTEGPAYEFALEAWRQSIDKLIQAVEIK